MSVDAKNIKSLEDYATSLLLGIISLETLKKFHVRAVEIGILTEDLNCRANTIVWDFGRLIKLYNDQLEGILELIPDDFDPQKILGSWKASEMKKARQLLKKKKEPKCDT